MDDLYSLLASADPQTLQAMIDAGLVDDRMGLAGKQLGIAHEQFNTPGADGRNVGHTYVASSPMEHLAVAMRRYQGARGMQGAQGRMADLAAAKGAGRMGYLKLLGKQGALQQFDPRDAGWYSGIDDPSNYG